MNLKHIAGSVLVSIMMIAIGAGVLEMQSRDQSKAVEPAPASAIGPVLSMQDEQQSFIVQGATLDLARAAVSAVRGNIEHELNVIKAVSARLTPTQRSTLENQPELRVYTNEVAQVQRWKRDWHKPNKHSWRYKGKADRSQRGKKFNRHYGYTNADELEVQEFELTEALDTHYPRQTRALDVHLLGNTGVGVTVAILDSGIARTPWIGGNRLKAEYDATLGALDKTRANDENGHGSHVTSIIASQGMTALREYNSIAPDASFVSVKAFDLNGMGSYADVINGINWIVENQARYNIRVLNMSFGTPPNTAYWDDPLAQAVMVAWQKGIVVVASAGNSGPEPMTIGVPGNVPYVITVGAITDSYTPHDPFDDTLVSFSAAGPTFEGHVKPDVVAYGGHMLGVMSEDVTLAINHPEFQAENSDNYYVMSGTSQAAAVVSGVVALMLSEDPETEQ